MRLSLLVWIALVVSGYLGAVIRDRAAIGQIALPFVDDGWHPADAALRGARAGLGAGLLLLGALGTGWAARRWLLSRARLSRVDGAIWSAVTGLGVAATGLAGLGFAGLLRVPLLWAAALACAAVGLHALGRRGRRRRGHPSRGRSGTLLWLFAGAAWLAGAVAGLGPVTEIDSLSYHLGKAALFLREGRILAPADSVNFHLPSLWEVHLAFGSAMGGDAAAGLMPSLVTLLTALMLRMALRPHGETVAALAAWLYITSFPVLGLSLTVKNDLAVALFGLASYVAARRRGGSWAVLAGCLLGFALATKPTALLAALPAGAAGWVNARVGHRAQRVACFAAATLVWSVAWPVRGWLDDGNPWYPVAGSRPGGPGPAAREIIHRERFGYTRGSYAALTDRLRAPWSLAAVEGSAMLPVLLLPFGLLAVAVPGPARPWAGAAVAMLAGWTIGPPHVRFLVQAYPAWCAAGAILAVTSRAGGPSIVALTVLSGLNLLRGGSDPALDVAGRLRVALGGESPASYLERRLPGYAHAIGWSNANLPRPARVLFHGEVRCVPLDRRGTPPSYAEPFGFLHLAAASRDGRHLAVKMRQSGATHMMVNRTTAVYRRHDHAPLLPAFRAFALWAGWWNRHAELLWESPIGTAREGAHYVFALTGPGGGAPGPVLPGIEGWLTMPERLAGAGRWRDAATSLHRIRRAAGNIPLLDHAEATIMGPVWPPARTRETMERAERRGLRTVSLFLSLAEHADRDGRSGDAHRYRARARALDPLAMGQ